MSSAPTPDGFRARRTRTILLAVAAAVALVVAVLLAVNASSGRPGAAGSDPGTVDPSASASASPTLPPAATETPAAPAPEAPAGADDGGDQPAAEPPAGSAGAPAFGDPVPAAVEAPVPVAEGVVVTVSGLEAVEGDGVGPGEIDGPAVRFTVRVANTTSAEISLLSAVVNTYFGESAAPGLQLSGSGARPLPVSVPAGGEVDGVYVFLLPEDRSTTRIEVFSVPQAAVVVAESPTPGA